MCSLQKEKEAFEREQLRLKQQEAVRASPQQVNRNLAHSGGGGGQEAVRSSPQQPNRSQSQQLIPPHGGPTGGGGGAPGTNQQQGKPPPGPTQQVRPPQMQRTQSGTPHTPSPLLLLVIQDPLSWQPVFFFWVKQRASEQRCFGLDNSSGFSSPSTSAGPTSAGVWFPRLGLFRSAELNFWFFVCFFVFGQF